ncbi:MAG: DUF2520 domain-containing protein [Bacteroidales bacterium]|nr:DUF2520 domain-containing protein [Bacteroidales bacterium]MCF8343462.1 DUF2520 domain-containing protein [Bacteroidales bacterium]MCF8352277.1 DUF2520 domain-containing protein [Bacteroidales bacterium]MCF8375668.1 DUF2520 domain-containing protein [Bacteroidales bacterium]MCF8401466.1 DUF2520 domain-containing protein [Bacteroidales bacterium]
MKLNIPQNIVLIGAGNVASHLGIALMLKGLNIVQVYSRTLETAKNLAFELSGDFTNSPGEIETNADLYIVSIPDQATGELLPQIMLKDELIVHTSGSLPMNILSGVSANHGVFYPLQTFSKKRKLDYSTIPFCIEANSLENLEKLHDLADLLSGRVFDLDSIQRKQAHLAAVFACNFSNHMFRISDDILKEYDIPFDLLKPLITETAAKVMEHHPKEAQTGPALRNDSQVIEEHLRLLEKHKDIRELYKQITRDINKRFNKDNK